MPNVIVGIHGLSNKPERDTLKEWWEASIREGLVKNLGIREAAFEFRMVYWADLVYRYALHVEPDFIHDALYNGQPYLNAPDGSLEQYEDSWADGARARIGSFLGPLSDRVMKTVGKGRLTNYLLRAKLQDLSFYYDRTKRLRGRDGVEAEARAVLKKDLENALVKANGNNLMLIAHSMGSIIGYDVLRDLDRKPRKSEEEIEFILHDFITIGSPLGVGLVKNNVRGERSYSKPSLRTPTVVKRRWANYADRKGPVAFDSHLRDDFGANSSAVRVEDDLVTNDYTAQGDRNPHKSYGYLRTPEISMHIQQFIEAGDSNS